MNTPNKPASCCMAQHHVSEVPNQSVHISCVLCLHSMSVAVERIKPRTKHTNIFLRNFSRIFFQGVRTVSSSFLLFVVSVGYGVAEMYRQSSFVFFSFFGKTSIRGRSGDAVKY